MHCTGKGDSIIDDIWASHFDRSYMCCGDFGAAAAVYKSQTANDAALGIRSQNGPAKNPITHNSRHSEACTVAGLFEFEWHLLFVKARHFFAYAWKQWITFVEPERDNSVEIAGRDRTYSRLSATGNAALLVQY